MATASTALLRHRQGWRLPVPRSQRLSPCRSQHRHHRPMRRPRRSLCARIRRAPRQSLLWWRTSFPHFLRSWPNRPATPARCLFRPQQADRSRQVKMYNRHEMLDLVRVDGHAKGIVARNMTTSEISRHAADCVILATGGYGNAFFFPPTLRVATSPPPTVPTNAARIRKPLLYPDPSHLHPRSR